MEHAPRHPRENGDPVNKPLMVSSAHPELVEGSNHSILSYEPFANVRVNEYKPLTPVPSPSRGEGDQYLVTHKLLAT